MVHGHDGLLVDPDDAGDIAASAIRLLEDDELAQTLGANGRERVASTFSVQKLVPANELFYRAVIQSFTRAIQPHPVTCT